MQTFRLTHVKKTLRVKDYYPACMTPGQINRAIEELDAVSSLLTDEFIAVGRGHETYSETDKLTDPLAEFSKAVFKARSSLTTEIYVRAGQQLRRMPTGRGYGPRKECPEPPKATGAPGSKFEESFERALAAAKG